MSTSESGTPPEPRVGSSSSTPMAISSARKRRGGSRKKDNSGRLVNRGKKATEASELPIESGKEIRSGAVNALDSIGVTQDEYQFQRWMAETFKSVDYTNPASPLELATNRDASSEQLRLARTYLNIRAIERKAMASDDPDDYEKFQLLSYKYNTTNAFMIAHKVVSDWTEEFMRRKELQASSKLLAGSSTARMGIFDTFKPQTTGLGDEDEEEPAPSA